MKNLILFLFALTAFSVTAQTNCQNAAPFCAGGVAGVTFPATTGTTSGQIGPDYDCNGLQANPISYYVPSPSWYYIQVGSSGSLDISIAGQMGTPPNTSPGGDVDFVCWGPFSSLNNICDSLTGAETIDCSYSPSYTESLNIPNGIAGQYYMVVITNFYNQPQNIVLNQYGGTGSTNCNIVPSSVVCAGSSKTLTVPNTSSLTSPSYSINPGALTNLTGTFVVTPLVTTTYTLYVTGVNSISATVTQPVVTTITVNPQPLSSPTTTQTTCTGTVNAIDLGLSFMPSSPTPSYTVSWTAPAPNGVTSNTQTIITGGITPGTYTAVIVAAGGCQTSTIVTINPLPAPSVFSLSPGGSSYTVTCAQPTVVLAGTKPNYNYTWSNGIVAPMSGDTSYYTSTSIGNWSVTGTDPVSTCVSVHTFTIYLNTTAPTSAVAPVNQSINCAIGSVATATGTAISPTTNVTHIWYSPATSNPVISGGQTSIFAPTIFGSNGTNTFVLVNNINGCSTTKTIEVTSTGGAFPTFNLTSNQTFSIGCTTRSLTNIQILGAQAAGGGVASFTLLPPSYTGGFTYSTSTSLDTYTINTPGTYTVVVRDNSNFCETRVPVSIVQNTFAPDISASVPSFTLNCFTPSVVLVGNSANSLQGPVDFDWAFQNGANPGDQLSYSIAVITNPAAPTNSIINNYTLTAYEVNNACSSKTVVTMYQNTYLPKPAIGTSTNIITCSTNSVNLNNASSTGIPPNTFTTYQPLVGLLWTGPTPQLPDSNSSTYAAYTPGTYTMIVEDKNNGCTSFTTATILDGRVYPILVTNTMVALDCEASITGGVKLAVSVQSLTPSQVTAQWFVPQPPPNVSGAGSLTLTTDGIGGYKISVTTNSNGCASDIFVEVTPGELNADFTPDKETGFAPLTVNFTNNSSSTSSVSGTSSITSVWSFGNGTTRTTTVNLPTSAVYTAPGTYTVTMFSSKGSCRDTVVKVITVDIPSKLVVPNVFTPNGDNSNDLFFVQAANLTQITAEIFDRWGNKIYEITSTTGNIAWDGKNQSGHEAPDGTYFYTIKAIGKDGQSYNTKGTVSLYR